jgi:hypothetical protein
MSIGRHFFGSLAVVAACIVAVPALAGAQGTSWEFEPYVGAYVPAVAVASIDAGGASAEAKHRTGFVLGADARGWFSRRLGFEGTVGYAWSDLRATGEISESETPTGDAITESANLWLANAKLLVRVTDPESPTLFYVGGGPAIIHRGGNAYDDFDGVKTRNLTDLGGVLAAAVRFPLFQSLGVRLGAEAYMYEAQLESTIMGEPGGTMQWESKFQTDFVLTAGFTFRTR